MMLFLVFNMKQEEYIDIRYFSFSLNYLLFCKNFNKEW